MQYAFSSCQSTPYSLLMNQEILPVYYTVATPLPPPQKILRYCVKEFYYLFFTCFLKLFYNGQLESVDSN